jgi:hypothetical protein
MANSEFKTAAAKLLEQHATKNPVAEAMQAESVENAGNVMQAEMKDSRTQVGQIVTPVQTQSSAAEKKTAVLQPKPKKVPITLPLLLSLAKTRLSLGLALGCCALMVLVVPELLIPKSFKIFNVVLGIIIGLTYGIILSFPRNEKVGTDHETE